MHRIILALAVACAVASSGCGGGSSAPASPPSGGAPAVSVTTAGTTTESEVQVAVAAIDPDPAETITCQVALQSQPRFSDVVLTGEAGDCRDATLVATFTPRFDGAYVVRVTVSDGVNAPVVEDVSIDVVSRYGGGAIAGTTATPSPAMTELVTALGAVPPTGGAVTAAAVYNAFAAIDGKSQGAALTWEQRPYDIVDVRDPEHFDAGHIPGSVNVPLQDLPGVLLAQPFFPSSDEASARRVLVVGYTQGDGSLGATLFAVGRKSGSGANPVAAKNAFWLAHGFGTWTFDKAAAPYRWDDDLGRYRFEWTAQTHPQYVEAGGAFDLAARPDHPFPNVEAFNEATTDPMKRILVRAREWAQWAIADADARGLARREAFVANWGVYKNLRDQGSPVQVVSLQNDAQWKASRAIGALRGVAATNPAQLAKLDPTAPILWHCFSNTGAVAPSFQAAMLGYRTRTLMYGITGALSRDSVGIAAGHNAFFQNITDASAGGNDFPIASAAKPAEAGSLAWARPAAKGCVGCHTDYGMQYTLAALAPSAPAPEVVSEGEG